MEPQRWRGWCARGLRGQPLCLRWGSAGRGGDRRAVGAVTRLAGEQPPALRPRFPCPTQPNLSARASVLPAQRPVPSAADLASSALWRCADPHSQTPGGAAGFARAVNQQRGSWQRRSFIRAPLPLNRRVRGGAVRISADLASASPAGAVRVAAESASAPSSHRRLPGSASRPCRRRSPGSADCWRRWSFPGPAAPDRRFCSPIVADPDPHHRVLPALQIAGNPTSSAFLAMLQVPSGSVSLLWSWRRQSDRF